MKYIKNVWLGFIQLLLGLDKFINAICFGDPQEYISSRLGKREDRLETFWSKVVDKIFFWEKNHTLNTIQKDEGSDAILK